MKLIVMPFIAVIALASCTGASLQPVSKSPGWTHMGNYRPDEPESLTDIPAPIRIKLFEHLRDRLGPFTERLTFTGGQMVDFDQLARDEPDSKNYKWEIHAYDLHFSFGIPSAGIQSYTAQIQLRSDGSVLEEIDLPDFATSPEKLEFISLKDAVSVAVEQGFNRKDIKTPQILYFKDSDSLVWAFYKLLSDDGFTTKSKVIYVSAHNGKVLKELVSTGDR